jgi:hypothetical protein
MKTKIRDNISIRTFLEENATILDGVDKYYYYIPFWFSKDEWGDEFEIHSFNNLPNELLTLIDKNRNEDKEEPIGDNL